MFAARDRGTVMKWVSLFFVGIVFCSSSALAQSDLVLLLNPNPNEDRVIFRTRSIIVGEADDRATGGDFRQFEQNLSLRYALIQNEDRELYFALDSHLVDLDTTGVFDETGASVPDNLYNVGIGALYRQTVHEDWRVGGQLRAGSASNKLFDSTDEMYLQGLAFLQVPHLEHTSWVAVLAVNTNWQFPVIPGFGYAFPVSARALAVVGFPFFGGAGQLTDKLGFQVVYWPVRNVDVSVNYQVTERIRPYTGFRWRGQYFSRAGRSDSDDRILLEDKRLFGGAVFDLTDKVALDLQAGYLFDRQLGEGDDYSDRNDNNFRIDSTWYASLALNVQF